MQEDSIYYDEQRLGRKWLWPLLILIDILLLLVIVNLLTNRVSIILSGLASIVLLASSAAIIYLFLYLRIAIKIDFDYLTVFISGRMVVKIPVSDISFTEITSYKRFPDYGGIGIGRSFKGKDPAYFLSHSQGVRIYFPLGRKIIIGAGDPQKIITAIIYAQQRKKILSERN